MINRISKALFLLILVELCLGGGGRFTAIGPVSLRMVLFSVALTISILLLIKNKSLPSEISKLMIGFAVVISIGLAVGLITRKPTNLNIDDVKPICYFIVLPFFFLTIDKATIEKITKVIKVTSIGMSTIFIVLLILD